MILLSPLPSQRYCVCLDQSCCIAVQVLNTSVDVVDEMLCVRASVESHLQHIEC